MLRSLNDSINDSCDDESTEQVAAGACRTSCCRCIIIVEPFSILDVHLIFILIVRSLNVPLKRGDESPTNIWRSKSMFETPEFFMFFHLIFLYLRP